MDPLEYRKQTKDQIEQITKDVNDFHGSLDLAREYEKTISMEMRRVSKIMKLNTVICIGFIIYVISKQ